MDEIITKELRLWASDRGFTSRHEIFRIADRIDERYDGFMSDNADLQVRLDASILQPVDIDGARWTGEDVDKPFTLTDGDKATGGLVREIAYGWPRDGWFIVDQYDAHYPADKCRHVTPEPTDSQERIDADVEKAPCEYFGRSGKSCIGCPADGGTTTTSCMRRQMSDLLRRQRERDGAGGQA